ncbi:MAG: thioredoxin domain-containing protein [bacterium]
MPRILPLTFAGLLFAVACDAPKPEPPERTFRSVIAERLREDARPDSFTPLADAGRILGASSARVWVVVVGDYQCGDCKAFNDAVLPVIKSDYVDRGLIRVALLNKPADAHLNAVAAAVSAACASAEGRFWETSARIFATQEQWSRLPDARPFIDSLAIAAGVDAATQHTCSERARGMKLVQTDRARTTTAGVDSLPTFFIGSHKLVGRTTVATFRAVIDSALAGR